jgi:hypothetical protein
MEAALMAEMTELLDTAWNELEKARQAYERGISALAEASGEFPTPQLLALMDGTTLSIGADQRLIDAYRKEMTSA